MIQFLSFRTETVLHVVVSNIKHLDGTCTKYPSICYPGPRDFLNNPPMGEIRAANASRCVAARFLPLGGLFRKPLEPE